MPAILFKEVNYSPSGLLHYIEMGQIGIPDIQRPFVWPNAKVGTDDKQKVSEVLKCVNSKADTSKPEDEIDQRDAPRQFYGLKEDEIKVVEGK